MKRKITFITSLIIIAMMLFTSNVFAAETFNYDGYTYVIEEVKLKTDSLSDSIRVLEMDENNNYIIEDFETGKIYRVNEKECTLMSNQEMLEFRNKKTTFMVVEPDYSICEYGNPYSYELGYIKTEDTQIDSNKEYYKAGNINSEGLIETFDSVSNPNVSEIDTYYEYVAFKWPDSTEIDNNITYYTQDPVTTRTYVKVANPISEDVYKYYIIVNEPNLIIRTFIEKIDKTKFEEDLEMFYPMEAYYDSENDEIYFKVQDWNMTKSIIYKTDGTKVKEFDEMMMISELGNKFFMAISDDYIGIPSPDITVTILDKEGNTVFESANMPYLHTLKYKDNITYLVEYNGVEGLKFYNMYATKIEEDNSNTNTDNDNNNNEANTGNNNNANTDNSDSEGTLIGPAPEVEPDKGEKDNTPPTGNATEESNIAMYVTIVIAIIGVVLASRKRK